MVISLKKYWNIDILLEEVKTNGSKLQISLNNHDFTVNIYQNYGGSLALT